MFWWKAGVISICMTVIVVFKFLSGPGDNTLVLTDQHKENLETLMEDKLNTCPRYSCNNKEFENQVFCHKSSINNPFDVHLKNCNTFNLMSDSDFWGKPIEKQHKLGCHHELNRCVKDQYVDKTNKKPGDTCINDYECQSNFCMADNNGKLKYCAGNGEKDTCSSDVDCIVGLYCGDDDTDQEKDVIPMNLGKE